MLTLKANIRAVITPSIEEVFVDWLYANSDASNEEEAERLVQCLENEQWDPELELEFGRFVSERAGFEDVATSPHFMTTHVSDFVVWR